MFRNKINHIEILFLLAISLGFFGLMSFDSNSWYYSAIGDEYAFFLSAKQIALGQHVNLLSQGGVYGIIPNLSSAYQALIMRLIGISNFGWKTSSVIIVIVSFLPFFLLVKILLNRKVALFAVSLLASSHYLWAYTHTGYSNIESIFPTITALFLFARSITNKEGYFWPSLGTGLFSALGFYTFYSSRVTIIIVLCCLLLLTINKSLSINRGLRILLVTFIGFIALFLPFLIVNGKTVFTTMFKESPISSNEFRLVSKTSLLFQNTARSLLAFNYNQHNGPYVTGSLLDPISGTLFLLGLIICLIGVKKNGPVLILSWYILGLITTGTFSEYSYVAVSRLNFLLPVVSIMGGLALDWLVCKLKNLYLAKLFPLLILLTIFYLNFTRFFFITPKRIVSTREATGLKAFQEHCSKNKTIIADENPAAVLDLALSSYELSERITTISTSTPDINLFSPFTCIIVTNSEHLYSKPLIHKLKMNFPDRQIAIVKDSSGEMSATVLKTH